MKNYLTVMAVVGLFLLFAGLQGWGDYTWSERATKVKATDGWSVAATQANYVDFTHPWTLFKQPIVSVAFVKLDELTSLKSGMVFTKVLWMHSPSLNMPEDTFSNIYDCRNHKNAFIEDGVLANQVDFASLEWRDSANTSSADIAKIVCR
ncbi:MAG: hypothetical protein WCJ29_01010 [bacterium]